MMTVDSVAPPVSSRRRVTDIVRLAERRASARRCREARRDGGPAIVNRVGDIPRAEGDERRDLQPGVAVLDVGVAEARRQTGRELTLRDTQVAQRELRLQSAVTHA